MNPNTHCNHFPIWLLCILTLITQKLHVVYGHSKYQTTALPSKISIFCVTTGCKIRVASYGSKHTSQYLSNKPFVHNYTHILQVQVVDGCSAYWMTVLLSETFLVWFMQLHERSDWRARSQTSISHSLIQHCVGILQAHAYMYITIWCATTCTPDNKTCVPYDCIHTKRRLYCQRCIVLWEQSWLATLHTVFSINPVN